MNTLAEYLPESLATGELSLESALAARSWEREGAVRWRLGTERGEAFLVEAAQRGPWRQFQLSGGAVPGSTNDRALHDNSGLFGPAKLVARPGNDPVCRLDVPEELTGSLEASFAYGEDVVDAHVAWARAVTALATGDVHQNAPARVLDEDSVAELKQAGWSASVDEGRAIIHLPLPGVYRQLTVTCRERAGVTLGTDLIELTDLEDDCLRAILLLAHEANARLPLVRMAVAESPKYITLRAEVSFGAALITGSLLLHSLHVFETAVGLTAREFEALRDVELARLVLSAAAMRDSVAPH